MQLDAELVKKGLLIIKDKMTKTLDEKGRKPFIGKSEFLGAAEEEFAELIQAVGNNDHDEVLDELLDLEILAVFESSLTGNNIDRVQGVIGDDLLDSVYSNLEEDLKKNPRVVFHSIHHILGSVSTEMARYRADLIRERRVSADCFEWIKENPFPLAIVCFHGILSVISGKLVW